MKKTTPELFATLQATVSIRCDNGVKYTNTDLANAINELRQPIATNALTDGSLIVTVYFAFPPSVEVQKQYLEHIINNAVPSQRDVTKQVNY